MSAIISQTINRQSCSLQYIPAQNLRNKARFLGANSKYLHKLARGLLKAMAQPTYFKYATPVSAPSSGQQERAGSWDVINILSLESQKTILLPLGDV